MKKGINFHSFSKELSYEQYLQLAAKAGYDGIELATGITGELNLYSNEQEFVDFRKKAERYGLQLFSTISMVFNQYPLVAESNQIREKAIELVKLQIRAAALLGADSTLVLPGKVDETIPYDIAYERSLDSLRKIIPTAEKYKINVALENVWNKFLLSPLEFRDFIDKFESSYVGNYFDIGNFVYDGYPEQWIRILGNRIKKVHAKDFRRSAGNGVSAGFVDLLSGDVDFKAVIAALSEIGYDSYITAEMTPYHQYSEQILFNTSNALDRILIG